MTEAPDLPPELWAPIEKEIGTLTERERATIRAARQFYRTRRPDPLPDWKSEGRNWAAIAEAARLLLENVDVIADEIAPDADGDIDEAADRLRETAKSAEAMAADAAAQVRRGAPRKRLQAILLADLLELWEKRHGKRVGNENGPLVRYVRAAIVNLDFDTADGTLKPSAIQKHARERWRK